MAEKPQAIRGMSDILPASSDHWRKLEQSLTAVLDSYGYHEIRLPILEKTDVFARAIGEHTDIVSKEMYTFTDRNGDSLTLRPEGTAGCVRAGLQHGLLRNQSQRLWYMGPMFRHERPQKGRYRQFHQLGIEAYGIPGPDIDAEQILICARLWKILGLDGLRLELNSLGEPETRATYRKRLVAYFQDHIDQLNDDARRRLELNPLRLLDSKDPELQPLIAAAPSITDDLDDASAEHFQQLCTLLDKVGLEYTLNPRLVRGLDYYNRTVFEWTTDRLGAQGTVCAGGRYDRLIEQIGGPSTPAIGFAIGLERLLELLEPADAPVTPHVYVIANEPAIASALQTADELREEFPGLRVLTHCGGGSMKSQFRRADKSGALIALVLGDEELAANRVTLKALRQQGEQLQVPQSELVEAVHRTLSNAELSPD